MIFGGKIKYNSKKCQAKKSEVQKCKWLVVHINSMQQLELQNWSKNVWYALSLKIK